MKTIYLKKWLGKDSDRLLLYRVRFKEEMGYFNGKAEVYGMKTGTWEPKDTVPDYTSGFGDSFLWDRISEEEAMEAIRAYNEKHPKDEQ